MKSSNLLVLFFVVVGVALFGADFYDYDVFAVTRAANNDYNDKQITVVVDTDVGTDIDDSWAIALLLSNRNINVKLIVTATGDTYGRAKVLAEFLERSGRVVPLGIGIRTNGSEPSFLSSRPSNFTFSDYSGEIYTDGIQRMIDVIKEEKEANRHVIFVALAPASNIAEYLNRYPEMPEDVEFVSMTGSVNTGYGGSNGAAPEANVVVDLGAAKSLFSSSHSWRTFTILPLDITWDAVVDGEEYSKLLRSIRGPNPNRMVKALITDYLYWTTVCPWANEGALPAEPSVRSSVLYDAVAAYAAIAVAKARIYPPPGSMTIRLGHVPAVDWSGTGMYVEKTLLKVNDTGYTVEEKHHQTNGPMMSVALMWTDLSKFSSWVVSSLA